MSENDLNNPSAAEDAGDDALGARLARHLSAELDGQRGRAAAAFRLYALAEQNAGTQRPPANPRAVWRGGPWTFALVGGAVAASIALLVTAAAPFWRTASTNNGGGTMRNVTPALSNGGATGMPPVVRTDSTTRTHYIDAGIVYDAQGRPMRRFRRVNVQETRWRNEATGEQVEQVVPAEDEVLYEMKTY